MPASKRIIKPGEKFGFLVVLAEIGQSKYYSRLWKCRCTKCPEHTVVIIHQSNLTTGHTKSCGCLKNQNKIRVRVGQQFGFLVVLAYAGHNRHGNKLLKCRCTRCPAQTVKTFLQRNLLSGDSRSCGCLRHDYSGRTHGLSRSREYKILIGMIQRCTNPRSVGYSRYGAIGVKVCRRWLGPNGFTNFLKDVGKRPSPKHSIGRYLDLGNYAPGNCRWMTSTEQATERKKRNLLKRKVA